MERENKIQSIKAKMAQLSPDSEAHKAYSEVLRELTGVTLHREVGENCESCQ